MKPTLDCDHSLVVENPIPRCGIASLFVHPIDNTEKCLMLQYEVRFQKSLECGGAYIKLRRDGSIQSAEDLRDDTPFVVMFGPDICGKMDRIHVIIPHFNPVSGKWSEHRLRGGPRPANDTRTHLYTLVIRRDDSVEILIDQINKFTGSLHTDFDPPFSAPPYPSPLTLTPRHCPTLRTTSPPTGWRSAVSVTRPTGTSRSRSSSL